MFKSEKLQQALDSTGRRRLSGLAGGLPTFLLEENEDRRRPLRIALAVAIVLHLGLFAVVFPEVDETPYKVGSQKVHYVVRQVRFQPPSPRQTVEKPQTKQKKKVIPVPDMTPDEPEPITLMEMEVPEAEGTLDVGAIVGIPEGPPDARAGAMALTGNIDPPVKVFSPRPLYTEEARRAGIQGIVILEAVVDADGTVRNVKVLKGLPMGLDKSAVDTVLTWRYEPARIEGRPVPVYFTFTISFSLT
jgi:protein TonB